ncbi:hypothetical protein CAPTEDRAFT_186014 [Capitella teleta]|uniref:Uncharacterized protein n=1 Tax=Capitella teleta TaxID=283909 RepID=R7V4E7_CAPTE|nr:hypothetical protein CAPTEDRAFT_186014 [Capitella teleta]|eukprot:ELU13342.1 hypothetical protein CAPTEDRAFT_186014 [Capitella teleta]
MKRLGLSRAYCKDEGTGTILRQFLSLPLLPQNNIPSQWNRLNSLCSIPGLSEFSQYVGNTWIHVHKPPRAPECWSVHQMSVRTNNDIEGWHNRLKTRGKSHRTFYDLIQVMHEENSLLDWNLARIRSEVLDRRQNRDYMAANEELRVLWDTLDCGEVAPLEPQGENTPPLHKRIFARGIKRRGSSLKSVRSKKARYKASKENEKEAGDEFEDFNLHLSFSSSSCSSDQSCHSPLLLPDARPFANDLVESELADPAPVHMIQLEETEPTFKIVPGGSSRGKDVLVSSDGFSYVHKRTLKSGAVVWRCVKRSKKTTCQVTVKQIGDKFAMQENRKHLHDPETDANTVRLVKKEIRDKALGQAGQMATKIVQEVVSKHKDDLTRALNLPKNPKDLSFELDHRTIPEEFLRVDVHLGDSRHFAFSTQTQIELLQKAKTWYMDGTFEIVKLKGGYFHFSQALFRRMKRLGLSRAYCKDEGTGTILRQFLSLPLLPQNNIPSQWNRLNSLCSTPGLSEFSQYVGKTWIHVHKPPRAPECWSVHQIGKSHRTFYDSIQVMHEENSLLDWNLARIRSEVLDRRQNKDYMAANEELRVLWDTLDCGKVTPEVFLLKAFKKKTSAMNQEVMASKASKKMKMSSYTSVEQSLSRRHGKEEDKEEEQHIRLHINYNDSDQPNTKERFGDSWKTLSFQCVIQYGGFCIKRKHFVW